jgi:four helix bundle protein
MHLTAPEDFPMIQSFRDLNVWQKGMDLAERVYLTSDKLPKSEVFGLISQMRRAVISIPSNIAEGKAIGGRNYPRHVKIALGSESELETQIELSRRLKMLSKVDADELLGHTCEVGRMLAALLKSLPRD